MCNKFQELVYTHLKQLAAIYLHIVYQNKYYA